MLQLWGERGHFPVKFYGLPGLLDDTQMVVEALKHLTPLIQQILTSIRDSWHFPERVLESVSSEKVLEVVSQLLCGLGARGVLTLLGVRKTIGSKDKVPPAREDLIRGFNKPFARNAVQFISQVGDLTEESKKRAAGACQLSVGARALMKHAHRSSEVTLTAEDAGRAIGASRRALRSSATPMPKNLSPTS